MDEAFEKLRREHNNNVESLVKWCQDSKIIDRTKDAEEKAMKLFEDVKDASNVELEKFKEVVAKLALQQQKSMEEFTKRLSDEGPKLMDAFRAGISAFKEAMSKK